MQTTINPHKIALSCEVERILHANLDRFGLDQIEVKLNTVDEPKLLKRPDIDICVNRKAIEHNGNTIQRQIDFRNKAIGTIAVSRLPEQQKHNTSIDSLLSELLNHILHLVERFHFHQSVFNNSPQSLGWVGFSQALRKVESQVRKFAAIDLPVLIEAERGTGKVSAAYAIHNLSPRKDNPFIECCCLKLSQDNAYETLKALYEKAKYGTLFIRNINELDENTLSRIRYFWEDNALGSHLSVRIIASIDKRHNSSNITHTNAPWLTLFLPTLREREQDIAALIAIYLQKYAVEKAIQLDEDCIRLLEQHSWTDNARGLEKAIAILSAMAEEPLVTKSSLLTTLPQLKQNDTENPSNSFDITKDTATLFADNEKKPIPAPLAHLILKEDFEQLPSCHAAITKSLSFIAKSYHQKITLDESAKRAFVSAPHLSYLYRKHLGTSFKQLVLDVRIEKAKQLLSEKLSLQVTQIAHDVGFHDLSHFEKTFRRLVGIAPLKFRHHSYH